MIDYITDAPDCIAPDSVEGAVDWAADFLGMQCGSSDAQFLVLGATTLAFSALMI